MELQENVRCRSGWVHRRLKGKRLLEKNLGFIATTSSKGLKGGEAAGEGKKAEERGYPWVYTCPALSQQAPTDLQHRNGWRLQSLVTEIIKELPLMEQR